MSDWLPNICSHAWIDRNDPPIQRATYSPIVGAYRRQMKPGKMYHCRNCTAVVIVQESPGSQETT
jgi:hypothetical protein